MHLSIYLYICVSYIYMYICIHGIYNIHVHQIVSARLCLFPDLTPTSSCSSRCSSCCSSPHRLRIQQLLARPGERIADTLQVRPAERTRCKTLLWEIDCFIYQHIAISIPYQRRFRSQAGSSATNWIVYSTIQLQHIMSHVDSLYQRG